MKNYREDYLAPLLKCPSELDQDLLKTAITFVECGGRLKEVAKRLFIHENTARYRMNKLKEKLESNSTEYEFHVNLSCAIKLHILSQEKKLLR